MRWYAAAIYVFLYLPIALIVLFSFNSGRYAMDWQGFSIDWYFKAFANPFAMKALWTSLTVGLWTAVLATVFGTLAALGLERMRGWLRQVFDGLIYIAIMVPGVVIGISTLVIVVGIMIVLVGAFALYVTVAGRALLREGTFWPEVLSACAYLLFGVLLLAMPLTSALVLVSIVGVLMILYGLFQLYIAWQLRGIDAKIA